MNSKPVGANQSRPDSSTPFRDSAVAHKLVIRPKGPGADETHLALEDVPELGQLVEPAPTHDSPDQAYTPGTRVYGSKLVQDDGLPPPPNSGIWVKERLRTVLSHKPRQSVHEKYGK